MAGLLAVHTEEGVAIRQKGVSRRVEAQEYCPQNPTRKGSADTEEEVERDAGTVANTGKDETESIVLAVFSLSWRQR